MKRVSVIFEGSRVSVSFDGKGLVRAFELAAGMTLDPLRRREVERLARCKLAFEEQTDIDKPKKGDIIYPYLDPFWERLDTGWNVIRFYPDEKGSKKLVTRTRKEPLNQGHETMNLDRRLAGLWTYSKEGGLIVFVQHDKRMRPLAKDVWAIPMHGPVLGLEVTSVGRKTAEAKVVEITLPK